MLDLVNKLPDDLQEYIFLHYLGDLRKRIMLRNFLFYSHLVERRHYRIVYELIYG